MDFNRAFRYMFEDKDWLTKIGLGLVIMIVPILNFAWIGYQVQIIRNVRNGEPLVLPTWDDLGKKFMDGLMITLANLVYALPAILFAGLPMLLMFIPMLGSSNQELFNVLMTGSTVVYFCVTCLIILYALALAVLTPMIKIHYAKEGTFAACFKIGAFLQTLRGYAAQYFTVLLVGMGISLGVGVAVSMVGSLVGWFPLIGQLVLFALGLAGPTYAALFSTHLYGQFSALVFGPENAMG